MKHIFFFTSLVKQDKLVAWRSFAQTFCPSVFCFTELDRIFFLFMGNVLGVLYLVRLVETVAKYLTVWE